MIGRKCIRLKVYKARRFIDFFLFSSLDRHKGIDKGYVTSSFAKNVNYISRLCTALIVESLHQENPKIGNMLFLLI